MGKDYEHTKTTARNLAVLLCWELEAKEKTRVLYSEYPALLEDAAGFEREHQDALRDFIA